MSAEHVGSFSVFLSAVFFDAFDVFLVMMIKNRAMMVIIMLLLYLRILRVLLSRHVIDGSFFLLPPNPKTPYS